MSQSAIKRTGKNLGKKSERPDSTIVLPILVTENGIERPYAGFDIMESRLKKGNLVTVKECRGSIIITIAGDHQYVLRPEDFLRAILDMKNPKMPDDARVRV